MANKEFKTRIKNKRDTAANWESRNPVILNGEIILVDTSTGELRAKIGDGTKKYNELSFSDEILKQSIESIQKTIDNGLPANGGNACTVDGKHAEDFVAATEFNRLVGDTPVAEQINTAQTAAQNYTDEKIEALKSGTVAKAETATKADIATKADSATQADNATTANHATTAGKATEADHADTATTANSATTAGHATTADTATEANHAITATSADKATKDGAGNVIVNTYETKADATAKLETAKSYTDSEMERLVGDTKVSEQIATSIVSKADANHNHDDRYYTKLEMDSKLGDKADKGHTHDYAASAHTHDDRYYTETEIDAKLIGKSDVNHTHDYASASHAHDDVYAKKTDVSTQFNTLVGDRSVATQINSAVDPLKTIIYKDTSGDINIDRTHTDAMNSKLEITGRDVIFTDYAMTEYPIISTLNNKSDKGHTHNYAGSSTAGGSATSADKLKTAVYIDGVPFNGSGDIDHLATCVTAAGTAAKVAGMANNYQFSLKVGARVTVRFANGNTAANPTLNVASTGAKPIYLGGLALPASQYWTSGSVLDFIYYGSAWELVTIPNDNNTTYSAASTSAAGLMSAADKTKLDGIATGANNYTYTLPTASSSTLGGVKVGSNITVSSGTISLTKANVTSALGYTPPTSDTNTTYSAGTGLSLSGTTFSLAGGIDDNVMMGQGTSSAPTWSHRDKTTCALYNRSKGNYISWIYDGGASTTTMYLRPGTGTTADSVKYYFGANTAPAEGVVTKAVSSTSSLSLSNNQDTISYNVASSVSYFRPTNTEKQCLGGSSYRWATIYSKNALNTGSDLNIKENIHVVPQKYIDMLDDIDPVMFKFKDGDRLHGGYISQWVEESMTKHGITAEEFGGFCKDAKLDDNGDVIDGEYIYSLRYSEFISIIHAKIKQMDAQYKGKIKELELKLKELESKL